MTLRTVLALMLLLGLSGCATPSLPERADAQTIELEPGVTLRYTRAGEYSVFENWRTWTSAREHYSLVQVPVTLVYSQFDWSTEEERIRNRVALPRATFVVVPNAGHFSAVERPYELAAAIRGE